MKKWEKALPIILVVALMLSVFAGCGSSKKEPSGTATTQSESTSTQTEATTAEEKPKFDLGGATIVWCYPGQLYMPVKGASDYSDKFYERIEYVEQLYNCKIEVTYNDNYWQELVSAAMAGVKLGDVIYGSPPELQTYVNNNIFAALDDYIDYNDPIVKKANQDITLFRGKHWGFNNTGLSVHPRMVYNKELTDKEGLEDPFEVWKRGEWTYEKFIEYTKKVTKDLDGDGIIDQWGLVDETPFMGWAEGAFRESNGVDMFVYDSSTQKYKFALQEKAALTAYNFWRSLIHEHKVMPMYDEGFQWNRKDGPFYQGKAGFALIHVGTFQFDAAPEGTREILMPKGPDVKDHVTNGNSWFTAVSALAENPAAVADIVKRVQTLWDPSMPGYLERDPDEQLREEAILYVKHENDFEVWKVAKANSRFMDLGVNSVTWPIIDGLFNETIKQGIAAETVIEKYKNVAEQMLAELNKQ